MEQRIGDFIAYLRDERGASANTQVSYQRDLRQLRSYLYGQGITNLEDINETSLNSYVLYLEREGKAAATVSRGITSAKSFFEYCLRRQMITADPTEKLRPPKVEKRFPQILTIQETECLMEQPNTENSKGIRDKAMLELLYATGIRVSELISLTMDDLNLAMEYIICHEKSKDRIIPFGTKAKTALQLYLTETRTKMLKGEDSSWLFVSCLGKPMSRQGFWKLIKHYTEKAGIEKEITPHTLRHSFAAHLLEKGADIRSVQEMLGHADVSTTQMYVEMQSKNMREVYKECHPRG